MRVLIQKCTGGPDVLKELLGRGLGCGFQLPCPSWPLKTVWSIEIYQLGAFHFNTLNIVGLYKTWRPSYTKRMLLICSPSKGMSSGLLFQRDVLQDSARPAICCQLWPLGRFQKGMIVSLISHLITLNNSRYSLASLKRRLTVGTQEMY